MTVDLGTQTASGGLTVGSVHGVEALEKETSHIPLMERDPARLCHATHNGAPFTTCDLFISGIFHIVLSDCGYVNLQKVEPE